MASISCVAITSIFCSSSALISTTSRRPVAGFTEELQPSASARTSVRASDEGALGIALDASCQEYGA